MNEWVKLEVGNDWMSIFYTYPGECLNACGTNDTNNALQLKAGQQVEVRMPSGAVRYVTLSDRRNTASYGDMGHTYSAEQVRFGFQLDVDGVKVWVPLELVEVRPDAFVRRRDVKPAAHTPRGIGGGL